MTYLAFQSQRIFAGVFISPKISRTIDREEQSDTGKCLLPSVYIIEKADPISSKTRGPGVLYVVVYFKHRYVGEYRVGEVNDPETPILLTTVVKVGSPEWLVEFVQYASHSVWALHIYLIQ